MTNNTSHRGDSSNRRKEQPSIQKALTDYKPALALKRIRFYVTVLEAHARAAGLIAREERHGEQRAEESDAREED